MNRVHEKLASLKAVAADCGIAVTVLYLMHRLLVLLSRGHAKLVPYAIVAQPLDKSRQSGLRHDPRTEVRKILANDPITASFPRPSQINDKRFESGTECYVITVKQRFAGHIWIARNSYEEDEVRCLYRLTNPELAVWDFDVYVEPEFRIGRTMARMWDAVALALSAQQVQWSFSRISLFNGKSLRAHQHLGAVRVSTVVFLVLWRAQLAVLSQAPFLHFTADPSWRPVMELEQPTPDTGGSAPAT